MPPRLNPASPGLTRLIAIARESEPVELVALQGFPLEAGALEAGDRFQCPRRLAAELIRSGLARRLASAA